MKLTGPSVALGAALLLSAGCQKQDIEPESPIICGWGFPQVEICTIAAAVQEKPAAQAGVLGDWQWLQTRYPTRGTAPTDTRVETPQSTGKNRVYRFTADRFIILEEGQPVFEKAYEVRFWGEGTNTVDPVLTIRTADPVSGYGVSVLRLDSGLSCLELINSYNDAGGDISLKKIIKSK